MKSVGASQSVREIGRDEFQSAHVVRRTLRDTPVPLYNRTFPWPRMGGWVRHGWISRFWGAPIFSPEVPKIPISQECLYFKGFGDL